MKILTIAFLAFLQIGFAFEAGSGFIKGDGYPVVDFFISILLLITILHLTEELDA